MAYKGQSVPAFEEQKEEFEVIYHEESEYKSARN
jgi:hypothetical protein